MALMPLARTIMDKKVAQATEAYTKKIERMFDSMVPWQKKQAGRRLRESLRGKVKPGEVVVILEAGESMSDPLFSGAKITRE